ncbi:MAG: hypothetical protein Q8Q15_01390 [bacterium]|nr:hypothetical protein [bacterium]
MEPDSPLPKPNIRKVYLVLSLIIFLTTLTVSFLFSSLQLNTKQSINPGQNQEPKAATASAATGKPDIVRQPAISPQITIELEVESTASGQIKGNIQVKNLSEKPLDKLYYDLYLRSPDVIDQTLIDGKKVTLFSQGPLITFFESKSFMLSSGEKKIIPFSLSYPSKINTGPYKLSVFISPDPGTSMGGTAKKVYLRGSGEFITVDGSQCKIVVGDREFTPNIGPNTDGVTPTKAVCTFTNAKTLPVSLKKSLEYAVNYVIGFPASEKLHFDGPQEITIGPKESKIVSIDLPTSLKPQVYQALFSLKDENGDSVSPLIPFRWIIRGPSARIDDLSLDRDFYRRGDKAVVSVSISPSMDLFWRFVQATTSASPNPDEGTDLENSQLKVNITSQTGQLCGEEVVPFSSTKQPGWSGKETIAVNIKNDCLNPKVNASFLEGDNPLAFYSKKFFSSNPQFSTQKNWKSQILVFMAFVTVLALLLAAVLLIRKRGDAKGGGTLIILFILASGLIILKIYQLPNWIENAAAVTHCPSCAQLSPTGPVRYESKDWNYGTEVDGDFWQAGSNIVRNADNSITVNFVGNVRGNACSNFAEGFDIYSYVDGSNNGLGNSSFRINPQAAGYNGPVTASFTITGPFQTQGGRHTLTLNFDLLINLPAGGVYDLHSSDPQVGPDQLGQRLPPNIGFLEQIFPAAYRVIGGRITSSGGAKPGINGVAVSVYDAYDGSRNFFTDGSGNWTASNFIQYMDTYNVYLPSTPAGFTGSGRTNTLGWTWNHNTKADTPFQQSVNYEYQQQGDNDCGGPNNVGTSYRCSFEFDPAPPPATPPPATPPPASPTPTPLPSTSPTPSPSPSPTPSPTPVPPWIQTTNGDVHSNSGISTP